jgi:predicted enzyme related to lactoylglutathione lyase
VADVASHVPGTFCWVELATTDPKAAVAFYRALFGWDIVEHDMGPEGVYTIFTMRGADVAATAGQQPQERQAGVPPHWNMYVSVASADDAASRATSLGATVLAPPFDVMHQGRMAVLQDPTGAVFQVWEPKAHIGVRILREPGALCWSELTTRDTKAAEAFYTALFGWNAKHSAPAAVMDYTEFSVDGQPAVGMMAMPEGMPPQVPSYWMPYFQVSDLDASTTRAKELGATVMVGPNAIPDGGRFTILQDPQRAVLAMYQSAR